MTRRGAKGPTSLLNEDIGFDLDRLFDHYNMDHIPAGKRLERFKHRNLPLIKHYKAAVNIFGGPLSRKRVIIAPPMETPLKRKLGMYMNQRQDPVPPVLNSPLKPVDVASKVLTSSEVLDQEEKEKESVYKKWYAERQALRGNLDKMGLSEALLQRKGDKSELEKRVHAQLKAARLWKPESPPPPEPVPEEKEPPVVPCMKVPVPSALQILDKFLADKKMRLIDLFRNADRNQDWKLTKEELLAAVDKYGIPLSGSDIEDLMVSLDRNFDEYLDFKEVAHGLEALKKERRAMRRQESTQQKPTVTHPSPLSKISPYSRDQVHSNQTNCSGVMSPLKEPVDQQGKEAASHFTAEDVGEVETAQGQSEKQVDSGSGSVSLSRSGSGHRSRSDTPNSLEPPPADLRDERRPASSCEEMVELRKHDKAVLEHAKSRKWPSSDKKGTRVDLPGVIRIGHKGVDNHCMTSTLEGEVGSLLDQFRRNCLKEYFEAIRMCQEKGVVLTPELLDRVLLYPAERPRTDCMKKLAIPIGPMVGLDAQFAKPRKKPKTPPEIRHKDKMKRSKNGTLMIDVRHMYPSWSKVAPVSSKENLSTGRALVSRKSDIWMTFEEYDKYTKHLPRRYKKLNIKSRPDSEGGDSSTITAYTRFELDSEKFWPGYMLDKLALYEPSADRITGWGDGQSALFHHTGQVKRGNTGKVKVTGPPVHADGRIVDYGIDKHRRLLPS